MINHEVMQAIEALDLEAIKVKLMHKSGESWSLGQATAAEQEYRRFLYLAKQHPTVPSAPAQDVDIFWHYHILDTAKYAEDCTVIFGYFLHHFPYIGLRGEDDAAVHERCAELTLAMYAEAFGSPAANEAAGGDAAYSIRAAEGAQASAYSIRSAPASDARAYSIRTAAAAEAPAYSIRTAAQTPAYSIRTAKAAQAPAASNDAAIAAYSIRTAASEDAATAAYSIRTAAPAYSIRTAARAYSIRTAAPAYSIRAAANDAPAPGASAYCIQLGGSALPDDYATRRPTLAEACA